jgi:hypothetical protein
LASRHLALAHAVAVGLLARLGRIRLPTAQLVALFALPLIPIACGYHFAHYLPVFLVDVRHAIRAASDPLARGWNLLGTRDLPVVTSFLSDPARVYAVWHAQVALIVAAQRELSSLIRSPCDWPGEGGRWRVSFRWFSS